MNDKFDSFSGLLRGALGDRLMAGSDMVDLFTEDVLFEFPYAPEGLPRRLGFIDADDIAAAAVACLVSAEPLNDDRILTGPEALSYEDTAGILSEVTGRTIRHVPLSPRDLALRFEAQGLPPDYAGILAGLDETIRTGVEDRTTDGVAGLTGKAAGSFRQFAGGNVGRWQA
ncbi:hypothetical protein [Cereibacter sphaeroides]|uniref:hypothetical protein n=1 Tax=Cereibacter sphaeroides TaxID=1063 RepID=UPI001F1C1000|nr:hypothetical protein [Cereibacter sphaeroides]